MGKKKSRAIALYGVIFFVTGPSKSNDYCGLTKQGTRSHRRGGDHQMPLGCEGDSLHQSAQLLWWHY